MLTTMRTVATALVFAVAMSGVALAKDAPKRAKPEGVWTVVIPKSFGGYIYTWQLDRNGSYKEDGRDAKTGETIQITQTGRWSAKGAKLELRQDSQGFVFKGQVRGDRYSGTLYQFDTIVSDFCAQKGETVPTDCDAPALVS